MASRYARAEAHELFLADGNSIAVWAANGKLLNDVTYSAESDSLFIAMWQAVNGSRAIVCLLARVTEGLRSECHSVPLTANARLLMVFFRSLHDEACLQFVGL